MTKFANTLLVALALAPSALRAQDSTLPDVQAYLCTFGSPAGSVIPMAVVVWNRADGSAFSVQPWFTEEVIRDGDDLLLRDGLNVMQVREGPSVIVDEDGGVSRGACTDATMVMQGAVAKALDAAVEASPDLEVRRALERAEAAESRADEAEASLARAQQANPEALEAVRRRNGELGQQVEELSEALAACRDSVQQFADNLPGISRTTPSAERCKSPAGGESRRKGAVSKSERQMRPHRARAPLTSAPAASLRRRACGAGAPASRGRAPC